MKKKNPSWLAIAYFFGAGTVLVLAGCYLFVTHLSVDVGRTLMAIGMLLELTAFFLTARRVIKHRRIA
ncbi:hypothetical protein [Fibrella aquatica]|uniref:hypothetical protein n=1 Tax=Fibrella aquatica TaxID=3242487 RepID=UPI003521ED6D